MRRSVFCISLFILQFCGGIFAQNPYIRHYTTHDGLASNTNYQMCQDSHKFLWFTSDAGVVKYDGTTFTTYRKKDGLSTNDIVRIKEDRKGRVWFFNYNGTVNYFFNNKIYNEKNSPFLKQLTAKSFILDFFTDYDKTIYFYNYEGEFFSLNPDNKVSKGLLPIENNKPGVPDLHMKSRVSYLGKNYLNEWTIWTRMGLYKLNDLKGSNIINDSKFSTRMVFTSRHNTFYFVPQEVTDYIVKVTATMGLNKIPYPGKTQKIRTILEDSEGYLWIAALDEGVYCMKNNKLIRRFDIKNALGILQDHEQNIWVSTQSDGIYAINHNILTQNHFDRSYFNNSGINMLCNYPQKGVWCLNSKEVFLFGRDRLFYTLAVPKSIQPLDIIHVMNNKTLVLGTKITGFYRFENIILNKSTRQINFSKETFVPVPLKKIFDDRNGLTTMFDTRRIYFNISSKQLSDNDGNQIEKQINNAYYNRENEFIINGKMNYIYRNKQLIPYNELSRFDGTIISDYLILNDSTELFNIDGDSLYLLKNHTFYNLSNTFDTPITLQIKKTIYNGSTLYLSTIKEVFVCYNPCRIMAGKKIVIRPLNISFNNINDILVKNDSLYIASDDGLTVIPESSVFKGRRTPTPIPYLRSITVNDLIYSSPLTELTLTGKNNLQLSFECISYFPGPATYSYMLEGAGNKWITGVGSDINLFYRNLPPGNYTFKLRVQKSDSDWSKPLVLAITIKPTLLEYPAFRAFLILLAGAIILISVLRIKTQRIREIEINHQLVVLEQKALQSMMNPHFIFNSLGSIQNYLLKNMRNEGIIYLSNFARLIRQNLNAVNTPMIQLQEEAERLENYMSLEKIRLEDKFDFSIKIDPALEEDEIFIPSMIIQPIVENSIWHGIASLNQQGIIKISFSKHDAKTLRITITDNGIGMKLSIENSNTEAPRKHLGMQIITKRLDLLGKKYNSKTSILYSECYPNTNHPGTLTELIVPFTYTQSES